VQLGIASAAPAGSSFEINGSRATQRRLRDGDELLLGATRLLFEDPAEEPIESLGAEPDQPVVPEPAPSPESSPSPSASASGPAPAASPSSTPAPPTRTRRPSRSFDADVIIYTLAAIVIAASVAALIALISAD
jgi:hypothetical protein